MDLFNDTPPLSDETRAMLALRLVPGIGTHLTRALVERFGSARQALQASVAELAEVPHISTAIAERLSKAWQNADVDQELALMLKHGVNMLLAGAAGYPSSLTQLAGAPALLFVAGQILPEDDRAIAVVGSRSCSSYGRRVAERLGMDLARAGFTVVSGLARGIDGAVHRGVLQAGGRTLAVLAGGLSKIYPPEHAELAEQVKASGALISESPMRMEPMAGMFPARNRIISGLSRAVVVVEAAEKSGALITATHAAEQGRDVFAIPGQVDSPHSGGTLKLLRQGVKLARHAGDILEDLQWHQAQDNSVEMTPVVAVPPGLQEPERQIWDFLAEPRTVDELAQKLARPMAELTGILFGLEMRKIVRRLPGNVYQRM
jgi:DNA processing protein